MKYHLRLPCIIPPSHGAIGCEQRTDEGKMAALIKTRVQGRSAFEGFNNRRDSLRGNSYPENPRFSSTYLVPGGREGGGGGFERDDLEPDLGDTFQNGRRGGAGPARSNKRNGTLEISSKLACSPSTNGHLHKFDLLRPKTRPPSDWPRRGVGAG